MHRPGSDTAPTRGREPDRFNPRNVTASAGENDPLRRREPSTCGRELASRSRSGACTECVCGPSIGAGRPRREAKCIVAVESLGSRPFVAASFMIFADERYEYVYVTEFTWRANPALASGGRIERDARPCAAITGTCSNSRRKVCGNPSRPEAAAGAHCVRTWRRHLPAADHHG